MIQLCTISSDETWDLHPDQNRTTINIYLSNRTSSMKSFSVGLWNRERSLVVADTIAHACAEAWLAINIIWLLSVANPRLDSSMCTSQFGFIAVNLCFEWKSTDKCFLNLFIPYNTIYFLSHWFYYRTSKSLRSLPRYAYDLSNSDSCAMRMATSGMHGDFLDRSR